MSLIKKLLNIFFSFSLVNTKNYSIYNSPNILTFNKNLNTTNIFSKSESQITCHELIKKCPDKVIAIREDGILRSDYTRWNCFYDSISKDNGVLWKSSCFVYGEIYDNDKVNINSFRVHLVPLLRNEILYMHIVMVLMIMHLLLRPFKKNLFYRSLNDLLFFICGYIIGSDSSYFTMDFFKTGNMILSNFTKN